MVPKFESGERVLHDASEKGVKATAPAEFEGVEYPLEFFARTRKLYLTPTLRLPSPMELAVPGKMMNG